MKLRPLKAIRVLLASIIFLFISYKLLELNSINPYETHVLLRSQFIPALLSASFLWIVFLLALTLLLGRVYCSVLCPLGILQDLFFRLRTWRYRLKSKKAPKLRYIKSNPFIRYSILFITVLTLLLGSTIILTHLDPYSNFARISSNLFKPIIIQANNLVAMLLMKNDNYTLHHISIGYLSIFSLVITLSIFLIIAVISMMRGRLVCNTVCPVGTFLGIISKNAVIRPIINKSNCTKCGLCETHCKSQCIDSISKKIDASRCVVCMNCIGVCKNNALKYTLPIPATQKIYKQNIQQTKQETQTPSNRRNFIVLAGTIVASSTTKKLFGNTTKIDSQSTHPIMPPSAGNKTDFSYKCTACHACITHCPSQILKPAALQYGIGYMLKPYVKFDTGYCNHECKVCIDICPNHALKKISTEEKKLLSIGVAQFKQDACIVYTEETSCGACSEHCPTQAVKMVPYKGHLTIPEIDSSICIGCGGCEYICPVRPERAISVVSAIMQKQAKAPSKEHKEDIKIDDFGF